MSEATSSKSKRDFLEKNIAKKKIEKVFSKYYDSNIDEP